MSPLKENWDVPSYKPFAIKPNYLIYSMVARGSLLLLLFISVVRSGGYYGSPITPYSNYGPSIPNAPYGYPASSFYSTIPGSMGSAYTATAQTYASNPMIASGNTQFGNFGISSSIPASAPIAITPPVSGSSSSFTSFSSSGYSSGASSVPSNYAVLTQTPTTTSSITVSPSTPFSSSSSNSGTFVTTGSISAGSSIFPGYTSSTTLGQISGVSSGSTVVSSSTQSQIASSQNQLISTVPASPNPINYEVTTVAKETPPIYFPSTVDS